MLTQKQLFEKENVLMPPTKLQAFREEFPWLNRYVDNDKVIQAYVSRIEPWFLNYTPVVEVERDFVYGFVVERRIEQIYLLDENGEQVITSIQKHRRRYKYRFWPFGRRITVSKTITVDRVLSDTTVAQTLDVLGDAAHRVRFILSYFKDTQAVIIYKTPKDMSVGEWVKQQLQAERNEIRRSAEEIDAAGVTV